MRARLAAVANSGDSAARSRRHKKNRDVMDILDNGLVAGMKEVGKLFARKEYYVPEVLLASEAFYAGFNIINPLIKSSARKPKAKVVMRLERASTVGLSSSTDSTNLDVGTSLPRSIT